MIYYMRVLSEEKNW